MVQKKFSLLMDNYKGITFESLKVIKLIFYGTPRAGKTTLRKRLLEPEEPFSSIPPCSTKVAESCGTVFVQQIVMTNEEGNAWKWNIQKLHDRAKTLLQCFNNPLLHGQGAGKNTQENKREVHRSTLAPQITNVDVQYTQSSADTKVLYEAPSQVEEKMNPRGPVVSPVTTANGAITDVDIKQLFYNAVKSKQWNDVLTALNIDKVILMHVIDGGGQPSFQEIFPLLVTGLSLTLLIFKLTDDLEKPNGVEYQPSDGKAQAWQDTYVVKDLIFQTISARTFSGKTVDKDDNPIGGTIQLVGTHMDQLEGSEDNKRSIINDMATSLDGWLHDLKAFKLINASCHKNIIIGVDNMKQEGLQEVKKCIETLISNIKPEKIPASWLVFDFVLHASSNEKKLCKVEISTCKEISKKCGVEETHFELLLRYFHHAGTLLYYADIPELRNIVITDFQLIFDSISNIIIKFFDASSCHYTDKSYFKEKGQFDAAGLVNVEGCLTINELLSLLQHRHILSKMGTENRFFMPSVLPRAKSNKKSTSSGSVLFMFEDGLCPVGLFCAVTTELIVSHKWHLKKSEHQCRDQIRFMVQSYHIKFSDFATCYEVHIVDEKVEPKTKSVIFKAVDEAFRIVCKSMSYSIPSCGFYCPKSTCKYGDVTYPPNEHPARCEYERGIMICYYSDESSELSVEHMSWFQQVNVNVQVIRTVKWSTAWRKFVRQCSSQNKWSLHYFLQYGDNACIYDYTKH